MSDQPVAVPPMPSAAPVDATAGAGASTPTPASGTGSTGAAVAGSGVQGSSQAGNANTSDPALASVPSTPPSATLEQGSQLPSAASATKPSASKTPAPDSKIFALATPLSRQVFEHLHITSTIFSHLSKADLISCACANQSALEIAVPVLWSSIKRSVVKDLVDSLVNLDRFRIYMNSVKTVALSEPYAINAVPTASLCQLFPSITRINFQGRLKQGDANYDFGCGLDKNGGDWKGLWLHFNTKVPAGVTLQHEGLFLSGKESTYTLLGLECGDTYFADLQADQYWALTADFDAVSDTKLDTILSSLRSLQLNSGPLKLESIYKRLPKLRRLVTLEVVFEQPFTKAQTPLWDTLGRHIDQHNPRLLNLNVFLRGPSSNYFLLSLSGGSDVFWRPKRYLRSLRFPCDLSGHFEGKPEAGVVKGEQELLRQLTDPRPRTRTDQRGHCYLDAAEIFIYLTAVPQLDHFMAAALLTKWTHTSSNVHFLPTYPQGASHKAILEWGKRVIKARYYMERMQDLRRKVGWFHIQKPAVSPPAASISAGRATASPATPHDGNASKAPNSTPSGGGTQNPKKSSDIPNDNGSGGGAPS